MPDDTCALEDLFFSPLLSEPPRGRRQGRLAQSSELKEPDFDAVRGRDDFRKLVAEVGAKAGPKAK